MGVVAMITSLIIVPVVSLFTKNSQEDNQKTEDLFSCYNTLVTVPASDVLTDTNIANENTTLKNLENEE